MELITFLFLVYEMAEELRVKKSDCPPSLMWKESEDATYTSGKSKQMFSFYFMCIPCLKWNAIFISIFLCYSQS